MVLGDFNAHVGSRADRDDLWDGVRGPHGYSVMNDAGSELLFFLLLYQASVCNTWFQKRNIDKWTWRHPKSNFFKDLDLQAPGYHLMPLNSLALGL